MVIGKSTIRSKSWKSRGIHGHFDFQYLTFVADHDKSLTNASIVEFKTQDRAFIFLIVKPL